jgi:hypothetical protein
MNNGSGGYRRFGRNLLGVGLGVAVMLGGVLGTLAAGEFGDAEKISGGGEDYEYAYSPYPVSHEQDVYLYTTTKDGKAQYYTYDGEKWSDPYEFEDQPATYTWDPVAVSHGGKQYLFYGTEDGKYYHSAYDGEAWGDWEDLSGDHKFVEAPYANKYGDDNIYLFGAASDGYLYYSAWSEDGWSDWEAVNEEYKSGKYQPHAVDWGGYENVFWTGEDGYVYWNRYDGTEWTGEKQLPYQDEEYKYAYAPYAVGYEKTGQLFTYAITEDGTPNWNTFSEDEGWSGWRPYDAEYPGEGYYQPYAYVYDDLQYVFITAKDGHAYYATYDGTEHSDWTDLGDNYDYQIGSYESGDDYYISYTGKNYYLYYKAYAAEEEDDGY